MLSKFADNPASFKELTKLLTVVDWVTEMLFVVPSPMVTSMVPSPPVYPNSASVVLVVVPLASLPPVRYPACATEMIFNDCVQFGALLEALIVAFVVSDTDVDFRLYADEKRRLLMLL